MIRKFLIFHSDEDFRLDNFKFKGEGGGKRSIQGESTKIEIHVFFFIKHLYLDILSYLYISRSNKYRVKFQRVY